MKDNGMEIEYNEAEQMIIKAACRCCEKSEFIDHDIAVAKFDAYVEMAIVLGQTTKDVVETIKIIVKNHYKLMKLLKEQEQEGKRHD